MATRATLLRRFPRLVHFVAGEAVRGRGRRLACPVTHPLPRVTVAAAAWRQGRSGVGAVAVAAGGAAVAGDGGETSLRLAVTPGATPRGDAPISVAKGMAVGAVLDQDRVRVDGHLDVGMTMVAGSGGERAR